MAWVRNGRSTAFVFRNKSKRGLPEIGARRPQRAAGRGRRGDAVRRTRSGADLDAAGFGLPGIAGALREVGHAKIADAEHEHIEGVIEEQRRAPSAFFGVRQQFLPIGGAIHRTPLQRDGVGPGAPFGPDRRLPGRDCYDSCERRRFGSDLHCGKR